MGLIRKSEAAARLGVSVRALERYTSQGKIGVRYERGKTRPVAVYDEADLAALRERLGRAVPLRETPLGPPPATETVSFRLDPFYLQELRAAAAAEGVSAGSYARRLVVSSLESRHAEDAGLLRRDVAALRADVRAFRSAFASSVYTLLLAAGRATTEEADEFVRACLIEPGAAPG